MKIKCISNKAGIHPNNSGELSVSSNCAPSSDLIEGKEYDLIEEKNGFYRIIDESGEAYWHPKRAFEVE